VGRPIGPRAVQALAAKLAPGAVTTAGQDEEHAAALELRELRATRARALLMDAPPPALDEVALRLGAAVHDILALAHPGLDGEDGDRARVRVAETALALADVGPPASAAEAVARHTLLARLPEVVQPERVVSHWLGRRRYVGRTPSALIRALPGTGGVAPQEIRRVWLREVGVAPPARPAWVALHRASPLGEALDPLRLDPPLAWERILPILRFPPLARLVAGRVLELGLSVAGGALASALFRYAAAGEPGAGAAPPASVAFAIRFLAHLLWLDRLFVQGAPPAPPEASDLAALLVAAWELEPRLLFPPDVSASSDVGRAFSTLLPEWRASVLSTAAERYEIARSVCRYAVVLRA
jgi:hypothetical protein